MAKLIRVSGTVQYTPDSPTVISSPGNPITFIGSTVNVINTNTTNSSTDNYSSFPYAISISSDGRNVGNDKGIEYDPGNIYDSADNRKKGAVYISGGVGIEKDLNVGGFIYGRVSTAVTSTELVIQDTNADKEYYPTFVEKLNSASGVTFYGDKTGIVGGLTYNPAQGRISLDRARVASNTPSTSTTTGALTVAGGVGIQGDLHVDNIVTKIISSIHDKIQIAPQPELNAARGLTEVIGDIRVLGKNPVGTAPVVTNVLYVTADGDDTNDGRAQDPSRACRTIGGAVNSPFYQPGTQILVSAGHYLEDNPIRLKPYTSVRGSDIRTTFIEPINKTQDLFHLDSGCYLNYMTFLNGRSGLLEGPYTDGTNRGAYCAAFPPLEGDERIDLFISPYIQNCTNQSGPWLKDGTMFLPNNTVQVPLAVATGTWPSNTTSIVVSVSTGTIEAGQYINAGQQNPGFFNARTLLLANKPFLQDQVVNFVENTFNSNAFTYDTVACARDTGLIIDSIAQDLLYDSTSESVFAGLQYWAQSGSSVPGEETTTTSATLYAKSIAVDLVTAVSPQDAAIVSDRFDDVVNILLNGTAGVTDTIISNGLPDEAKRDSYDALISNKALIQDSTINFINTELTGEFTYDSVKCGRDVDLIVDAVVQDLLFGGDTQSTFAGLQYWAQSVGYVGNITNELTTTTAAVNYVKSLAAKVVQGIQVVDGYQNDIKQVIGLNTATVVEADDISNKFDIVTNILTNGTAGVTDLIVPNGIVKSSSTTVNYAFNLLQANKEYLKAEAIAFVDSTTNTFKFESAQQQKCARDTGLIIDAITHDVLFDGTSQSEFAGLQYWAQSVGYVGNISSELTTTTSAINYLKSRVEELILTVSTTGVANTVNSLFTTITSILNNGTSGITDLIIPNGITSSSLRSVVNAYNIIQSNKTSLQSQVIDYVEATKGVGFTYDQVTCARDVGYILDSISFDLLYGGNKQSIQSGVYYYGYSSNSVFNNTGSDETDEALAAYQYIRTLISNIVKGIPVSSPLQTAVQQVIGAGGTDDEVLWAEEKIDLIINIITSGPSVVAEKTPVSLTKLAGLTGIELFYANRDFIKAEVIEYVKQLTASTYRYDRTKCARDVGYILDSVSFDLLYGGNKQSIQSGVYYYGYSTNSVLNNTGSNETSQVISAYNYIKKLLPDVIRGIKFATPIQNVVYQSLGAGGSLIEVESAIEKVDNIIRIIQNGPSAAGQKLAISLTPSPLVDVTSSATLLRTNKAFIKAEVISHVNTLRSFVYDVEKCRRDISYIVDSVAYDLLHGGNKQSIKAGVYYYNYTSDSVLDITLPNETPQVTAAYNYIKNLISKIITSTAIPKLSPSVPNQVVSYNNASVVEAGILESKIDVITDIIRNGPTNIVKEPINLVQNNKTEVLNAYNLLISNKEFIKGQVLAYIDAEFNQFTFAKEYCRRDVGILVENISYDAAFGGNKKSIESGIAYYDGAVSKIAGQETQTISAIDYLNSLCQSIIRNQSVTRQLGSDPLIVQVINTKLTGGEISSQSLTDLFNIVTDIIGNGPSAKPQVYSDIGPDAAFVSAEVLLQANRQFIQENTINYVNWNLANKSFPYSKIKCKRDTRLIIDAVALDLLYPTQTYSQSTFAGLQYWNQESYTGKIKQELTQTVAAIEYLKVISNKVIQNITVQDDAILGIIRYSTGVQNTNFEAATSNEVSLITSEIDLIKSILSTGNSGWTDKIVLNGNPTDLPSVYNAVDLIQANKLYITNEVVAYIDYFYPTFDYDRISCKRDIGYILDSICFDLIHGGNKQAIQSGLSYYGVENTGVVIEGQSAQTVAAFDRIKSIVPLIVTNQLVAPTSGTVVLQDISLPASTTEEAQLIVNALNTITNIINNGPVVASPLVPISLERSMTEETMNAFNLLQANIDFIVDEVIHYVDATYNQGSFDYNEELCYRDVGLIVDAVSQDILLGGNQKSVESGLAYWNSGYNKVAGQETTTTLAINYAKNISLEVIANREVIVQTGTNAKQVINPYFQYGGDYMPQEAVRRNFGIVTRILENGPEYAPPIYAGGGLFALTGLNGASVNISPRVTSVQEFGNGTTLVGLSSPTVGFGNNSTLYFGNVTTYPVLDKDVPNEWAHRKVDNIGAMGGALIDGNVVSSRSPIQSFVFDAFTQVSQGGRGIHITNDGYAQLVSVFTIFCSVGVQVDNGGIASILNSNNNFGDLCLVAKGYGKRKFSGTIYNPRDKAYPESPDLPELGENNNYYNQYYPAGFWPNDARVCVFVPDLDDRPHISLVMEVVPPEKLLDIDGNLISQVNEEGFPGFLNAKVTKGLLSTGTLVLTDVDTTGIAIGNTVYIRDQEGRSTGSDLNLYVPDNTIVTDVGYRSVTLSKSLTSGGTDPEFGEANTTYFNIYFCGNAYYTVVRSDVADVPKYNRLNKLIPNKTNILSTASTGLTIDQVPAHVDALDYLNVLVSSVVSNSEYTGTRYSSETQVTDAFIVGGDISIPFIDLRFSDIKRIVSAATFEAADSVVPVRYRFKEGISPQGAGSAINLIKKNINFLTEEINGFVVSTTTVSGEFDQVKCKRDVGIILQRLIYDLETGGNYNSVMAGLSYWKREGSYHIVQLGENVRRNELFPDGATVNFYQRSYISATGYVFEYVGAGTNYGALPQVGRADPVQGKETVQLDGGKVFFTSSDQNGDFRIGPGLVISQATGVLSGRTFTKSLFANMTPFILAIETGGV